MPDQESMQYQRVKKEPSLISVCQKNPFFFWEAFFICHDWLTDLNVKTKMDTNTGVLTWLSDIDDGFIK